MKELTILKTRARSLLTETLSNQLSNVILCSLCFFLQFLVLIFDHNFINLFIYLIIVTITFTSSVLYNNSYIDIHHPSASSPSQPIRRDPILLVDFHQILSINSFVKIHGPFTLLTFCLNSTLFSHFDIIRHFHS